MPHAGRRATAGSFGWGLLGAPSEPGQDRLRDSWHPLQRQSLQSPLVQPETAPATPPVAHLRLAGPEESPEIPASRAAKPPVPCHDISQSATAQPFTSPACRPRRLLCLPHWRGAGPTRPDLQTKTGLAIDPPPTPTPADTYPLSEPLGSYPSSRTGSSGMQCNEEQNGFDTTPYSRQCHPGLALFTGPLMNTIR